jgi:hypothetical protein
MFYSNDKSRLESITIKPKPFLSTYIFKGDFNKVFTKDLTIRDNFTMKQIQFEKKLDLEKFRGDPLVELKGGGDDEKALLASDVLNIKEDIRNALNNSIFCSLNSFEQFKMILISIKSRTGIITPDEIKDIKKICRDQKSSRLSDFLNTKKEEIAIAMTSLIGLERKNTDIVIIFLQNLSKLINALAEQENIMISAVQKLEEFISKDKLNELEALYKETSEKIETIKQEILKLLEEKN